MSYRFMRVIVFFDLPTLTTSQRRTYRNFRKFLITSGFYMMQESVYCKIALNAVAADAVIKNVKLNLPSDGLVQLLTVTERQFSRMEVLVGEAHNDVLNSDERLVVL